jgi:hypothetical protein
VFALFQFPVEFALYGTTHRFSRQLVCCVVALYHHTFHGYWYLGATRNEALLLAVPKIAISDVLFVVAIAFVFCNRTL